MACRAQPKITPQTQFLIYVQSLHFCHIWPKCLRFLWFMPLFGICNPWEQFSYSSLLVFSKDISIIISNFEPLCRNLKIKIVTREGVVVSYSPDQKNKLLILNCVPQKIYELMSSKVRSLWEASYAILISFKKCCHICCCYIENDNTFWKKGGSRNWLLKMNGL